MFEIFIEPDVRSLCLESCHGNRRWGWNLAEAPLVAHDHPQATWTRRPKCLLYPDLLIMLPGFGKALHFVIMFAIIDIHLFWHCCVLPLDIKVGCPLKTVAGKGNILQHSRSGVEDLKHLPRQGRCLQPVRLEQALPGSEEVRPHQLEENHLISKYQHLQHWAKIISSSYFHLLNKVGKTWGLCWVGDLAKEKFCKFRQFVFFWIQYWGANLVQLQGKVIISHNRWVWRLAGTSLLLGDNICWALDILRLFRIVTITGFVTAASTFSRDKMKIKEPNQPRPERPQCQAQPLFPPSKVFAGFDFTKLLHSWSPSHQGDH